MKVIFMHCNYKRSNKKAKKEILNKLFSLKTINNLNEMSESDIKDFFNKINADLDFKNKEEFEIMYLNYFLASKKVKNNALIGNEIKEIACSLEDSTKEITLFENKAVNNGIINTIKKTIVKLAKFVNKPMTKRIIFGAIAIALTLSCYRLEYSVAPCFANGGSNGIDLAFYYIRMISGVICFICMTIEIVQNAVQGDVRVIWYVVAKYLAIMVAILSFRKIFNIIDGVFNG